MMMTIIFTFQQGTCALWGGNEKVPLSLVRQPAISLLIVQRVNRKTLAHFDVS